MNSGLLRTVSATVFWVCAAAVLWLALAPIGDAPQLGWDKANHVLAFAVLGGLGLAAWPARPPRLAAALLGYGAAIELLQALTPTRQADWRDVVADALGIALAWGAALAAARLQRR